MLTLGTSSKFPESKSASCNTTCNGGLMEASKQQAFHWNTSNSSQPGLRSGCSRNKGPRRRPSEGILQAAHMQQGQNNSTSPKAFYLREAFICCGPVQLSHPLGRSRWAGDLEAGAGRGILEGIGWVAWRLWSSSLAPPKTSLKALRVLGWSVASDWLLK